MRHILTLVMLAAILVGPTLHAAEKDTADVEANIKKGLASYKDGKVQDAIAALQDAITAMQKSQQKGLASFFPKAPAGWTAKELESNSMTMQGTDSKDGNTSYTQLAQEFVRTSDDLQVKITLTNASFLVAAQADVIKTYKNPEILKALNAEDKNKISVIEQDGWTGWRMIEKDSHAEITAFCGSCLLTIRVEKDDPTVLDTFWKAINLKGIAASETASAKPKAKE